MDTTAGFDQERHSELFRAYIERHVPSLARHPRVIAWIRKAMAVEDLVEVLQDLVGRQGLDAVRELLRLTGVSASYRGVERIPREGPLLVVANHPLGAADVFLLLDLVGRVRPDVLCVINKLGPAMIPQVESLCLPVDSYARFDLAARARILAALRGGSAVLLFPAGGISKLTWRGVTDHRWKHGVAHFSREAPADVLPIHVSGRSSRTFLALPRKLRSFLVAREMLHPVEQSVVVRVGRPIPHARLSGRSPGAVAADLRQVTYRLADGPLHGSKAGRARSQPA